MCFELIFIVVLDNDMVSLVGVYKFSNIFIIVWRNPISISFITIFVFLIILNFIIYIYILEKFYHSVWISNKEIKSD